jgi:hypothetical protein
MAAQFIDASILCISSLSQNGMFGSDGPEIVRGVLSDGRQFEVAGSPITTQSSFSSHSPPVFATYFNTLGVRTRPSSKVHTSRYGLTNFEFVGTKPVEDRGQQILGLPLTLNGVDRQTQVTIVPEREDEDHVSRRRRRINLTAEIIVDATSISIEDSNRLIDRLINILSIARGTSIQWIYRRDLDASGAEIAREHFGRITKPLCVLPIIDPRAQGRHLTASFIEKAFPKYLANEERFEFKAGLITAYLDAKGEGDYLEMRGSKAAVTLEMLKAAYLDNCCESQHEYCIPDSLFKGQTARSLNKGIRSILKRLGISKKAREHIADVAKLQGLNRRSFASILREMCEHIGLVVDKSELRLLVKCRNSLVHRGRFYCETATAEDRSRCRPKESMWEEYIFITNFLDRFFLKLLGHSGEYCNYRGDKMELP